jgi:two-component system KDP operon response regulator KdpE
MTSPTILIVDDEEPIREFIRRNLDVRSYRTVLAGDGRAALAALERDAIDLIILDVIMPTHTGLVVCRRIRQTSTVPIIVLTALGEQADKITAFDLGADDFLTKPFGVGELLARIKAVLRRARWESTPPTTGTLRYGDLEIDLERRRVWRSDQEIRLTPTEFALLAELATHAGQGADTPPCCKKWGRNMAAITSICAYTSTGCATNWKPIPLNPAICTPSKASVTLSNPSRC